MAKIRLGINSQQLLEIRRHRFKNAYTKRAEYILAFRGHWVKENGLKKQSSVIITIGCFSLMNDKYFEAWG
ncbi:hypothetical protein C0R09_06730 [Brevibacillus laterosporus]|nr:hypothetical protein C0R09_06730 [Brevibacillus laterosporus]